MSNDRVQPHASVEEGVMGCFAMAAFVGQKRESKILSPRFPQTLLNLIVCYIFIAGGVVIFWRGTWGLLDILVFPFEPDDNLMRLKSAIVCFSGGFVISGICTIVSYVARSYRVDEKQWPDKFAIPASYLWTYVQGVGAVACWRGVWLMWDLLPVSLALQAVSGHVAGIVITSILVSFKSVLAPPAFVGCDLDFDLTMPKWFVLGDRIS